MLKFFDGYIYIVLTLFFTVYGQLVLKWQIAKEGVFPEGLAEKLFFLLKQFVNPWILSGLFAAFLASLAWMAAMTKFELGKAYPFMSLAFILVMIFSIMFLGENLTANKLIGTAMVVLGLIIITN